MVAKIFEAVIFDLDGTIINSKQDIIKALKKIQFQCSINLGNRKLETDIIGPKIDILVKNILQSDIDKLETKTKNQFRQNYNNSNFENTTIYPNMCEILNLLSHNNIKLFLVTNKAKSSVTILLDKLEIKSIWQEVCANGVKEESTLKKEDHIKYLLEKYKLSKDKTCIIGDSKDDMLAAKNVGITGLAAGWGYEKDKEKLKNISRLYFKTPNDLLNFFKLSEIYSS